MRERQERIAKGLDMAKKAEERSSETQEEYEKMLGKARKESAEIIEKAKGDADVLRKEMLEETNKKIDAMLVRAKEQLAQQKDAMLLSAKKEIGDLVVSATEQVASKKLEQEGDEELISDALSAFRKSSS
jgi:F-type H+-transporting ATPase subunit b